MLISLLLSAALAQDAPAQPAPSVSEATVYQHFTYIIEVPGPCPRVNRKPAWCLLAEGQLGAGSWTPAVGSDGEFLSFPTQADGLDYLSQSGWEIWHLKVSDLRGAARVDVRRPVAAPTPR